MKLFLLFSWQLLIEVSCPWKMTCSLILMCLCMQVTSSEWLLGIQIQQFENLYNAEIKQEQFCCCDISTSDCNGNMTLLKDAIINCSFQCQVYYKIHIQVCPVNAICTTNTSVDFKGLDSSMISSMVFSIPIDDTELGQYVRTKQDNNNLSFNSTIIRVKSTPFACTLGWWELWMLGNNYLTFVIQTNTIFRTCNKMILI